MREHINRLVRFAGVGATGVPVDMALTTAAAVVVGLLPAQTVG